MYTQVFEYFIITKTDKKYIFIQRDKYNIALAGGRSIQLSADEAEKASYTDVRIGKVFWVQQVQQPDGVCEPS